MTKRFRVAPSFASRHASIHGSAHGLFPGERRQVGARAREERAREGAKVPDNFERAEWRPQDDRADAGAEHPEPAAV
eukprot:773579-Prymnesium_polylepis.1